MRDEPRRINFQAISELFKTTEPVPLETPEDVREAFYRVLRETRAACQLCHVEPCPAELTLLKHLPKVEIEA